MTDIKVKPSQGAVRAAREIYDIHATAARLSGAIGVGDKRESNIELLAQLIDDRTGAKEMREALERIVENAEYQHGATYTISTREIEKAESALRNQKGECEHHETRD